MFSRVLRSVAIGFLQFVLILLFTLAGSFAVDMNASANATGVVLVLTLTSLLGIGLGGWVGLRAGWIPTGAALWMRILVAAIAIVTVLALGLVLGQIREASPFLTGAMVAGILGFHAVGWVGRSRSGSRQ